MTQEAQENGFMLAIVIIVCAALVVGWAVINFGGI